MKFQEHVEKRRTFGIISHPDAGKTTITEKILLYGGAISMAGTVKAKKSKKYATSDWMELEKQRGISVTSSVMAFPYKGFSVNLIDTPGHEDFSEDTYRTLSAVDSALMLIDAVNGVEKQTIKLFKVCAMKKTPIMAFINKLDRPGKDPLSLLEEIEKVLGIETFPVNWPIGGGSDFRGVYDRLKKEILIYENSSTRSSKVKVKDLNLFDVKLRSELGEEFTKQLIDEIEMLDIAGNEFDVQAYLEGKLIPVFFGSALNNFGIETLLDNFVKIAPSPRPRSTKEREVSSVEEKFSAFIFKIQANMDASHRDRVAFMRICSGKFDRGMKAFHVRSKRQMRLGRPTQFMAKDRSLVDEAYSGDIVGIHDPGIFRIGDSLTTGENLNYTGVPVFAPENFYLVQLKDPLKSKQLKKALTQLSEEGAVQTFYPLNSNDIYLGVVGVLQIDVVKFRVNSEYGVNVTMKPLSYSCARWVESDKSEDLKKFIHDHSSNLCYDGQNKPTLLIDFEWRLKFYEERNPSIIFRQTSELFDVDE